MKHLFVIATASAGKIRDFAHILGTDHYEFKTLKDIGFDEEIVEDGNSFAEHAMRDFEFLGLTWDEGPYYQQGREEASCIPDRIYI